MPSSNHIGSGSTSAKLLNFLFLTCELVRISTLALLPPTPPLFNLQTPRSACLRISAPMSAIAPPRLMLRHTRFVARQTTRRHASTTEAAKEAIQNTAAKSKETASNVESQASQGLSRVTSSAGSALSGAAQSASNVAGRIGGRTGRLIGFVQCE